jgi:GNAT superfamily N-acetyltransferase
MPRQDDAGTGATRAPGDAGTDATPVPNDARTEAALTVARVPVALTYPLRGRVLRPGAPPARVHLDVDDLAETAAFAATDEAGTVVGTAIVYPEACPWLPERPGAWRLRGMATDEGRRDAGVGARVLAAILDHVRANAGTLVWCNARIPARRFYERAGFVGHGDVWDEPEIGPHIAMWREV